MMNIGRARFMPWPPAMSAASSASVAVRIASCESRGPGMPKRTDLPTRHILKALEHPEGGAGDDSTRLGLQREIAFCSCLLQARSRAFEAWITLSLFILRLLSQKRGEPGRLGDLSQTREFIALQASGRRKSSGRTGFRVAPVRAVWPLPRCSGRFPALPYPPW